MNFGFEIEIGKITRARIESEFQFFVLYRNRRKVALAVLALGTVNQNRILDFASSEFESEFESGTKNRLTSFIYIVIVLTLAGKKSYNIFAGLQIANQNIPKFPYLDLKIRVKIEKLEM